MKLFIAAVHHTCAGEVDFVACSNWNIEGSTGTGPEKIVNVIRC